ncbi:MAG: restriction endonuclease subunit S, partial [Clostridia bacterium]|nr:restriction endonuclease subunit S [Clostridia bacterium]
WEFRDKGTVFIPNGLCRCIALGDIVALPFVLKSENNLKIMLPIEHLIIILPYTTVYFEYHALGAIIYMKTTEILTSINAFMVAIKSMVGSSGRQRVQQDVLENLELVLPDYETQVHVGKVLSAFDDKIELNTQINHNLEGIAA